jgi:hypothetical protein
MRNWLVRLAWRIGDFFFRAGRVLTQFVIARSPENRATKQSI